MLCWHSSAGEFQGKVRQLNGNGRHNGNGRNHRPDPPPTRPKPTFLTAEAAIEAAAPRDGKLAVVWVYPGDAMRVARFNLPDAGKEFRPVHPVANGWAIGDRPGKLPLYRGDELPGDGPIVVVEGEKCAELARELGLAAVTSAHGSSAAAKSNWNPLAGREVWILPDADDAGEKYAQAVGRILIGLGCKVKIVRLPDLPPGGDIEQFDAAIGGTPQDTRAEIIGLAEAAPPVKLPDLPSDADVKNHKVSDRGPVLVCVADIEPREIQWVWQGRIPLGRITLFVGRPGTGKSFLCAEITARVTTGSPWPDGSGNASPGDVLIISAEDDAHDTIRPRLDSCRADVKRVHLLTAVNWTNDDGEKSERVFTLEDVNNLEIALQRLPECKLVIIDPIGSYIGSGTDSHKDNEVRGILAPVAQLAERHSVAMLIVAHRRKATGETADDTALGSRAFTGIARAVWHLSRDPENKARRLLLPGKQNLSEEPDGLAFTIAGDPPRVQWEADPVRMNADDALADERSPGPEPEQREAAAAWLRGLLAAGPVETKELERRVKEDGQKWRTVRRAADEIGVIKEKNVYSKRYQWRLPKPGNVVVQVGGQPIDGGQPGQAGQPTEKTE